MNGFRFYGNMELNLTYARIDNRWVLMSVTTASCSSNCRCLVGRFAGLVGRSVPNSINESSLYSLASFELCRIVVCFNLYLQITHIILLSMFVY